MKRKFMRCWLNKWKKMKSRVIPCACECCCKWGLWSAMHEGRSIPSDVPKGHLVVYVGENAKRFVIKLTLLSHPLFKALLDQAREEYDFVSYSKLSIPCDEHLFLSVIRCASSPKNKGASLCFCEIRR